MTARPKALSVFAFPVLLALASCGEAPAGAASSGATTTASASAPAPVASTAAAASAATSAPVAPSAQTSEPAPPSSPEPTLKEWDAVKQDLALVKGWGGPGCMPRRVREWIRVGCSGQMLQKGEPVAIRVKKGFKPTPLSIMTERAGTIWLVFPFTEGLDGEAEFEFTGGTFTFRASWPKGAPEPKVVGSFEEAAAPAPQPDTLAGASDDGAPNSEAPAEQPAQPAKPTLTTDPLPDEPSLAGAPTREEWDKLKEVGVRGSDARGCQTKQSGDWFRVVCRANDVTGKLTSATATKGFDDKQGYIAVGNGSLVLVTRYVRGSDLAFDLTWEKQSAKLELAWPETSSGPPGIRGQFK